MPHAALVTETDVPVVRQLSAGSKARLTAAIAPGQACMEPKKGPLSLFQLLSAPSQCSLEPKAPAVKMPPLRFLIMKKPASSADAAANRATQQAAGLSSIAPQHASVGTLGKRAAAHPQSQGRPKGSSQRKPEEGNAMLVLGEDPAARRQAHPRPPKPAMDFVNHYGEQHDWVSLFSYACLSFIRICFKIKHVQWWMPAR